MKTVVQPVNVIIHAKDIFAERKKNAWLLRTHLVQSFCVLKYQFVCRSFKETLAFDVFPLVLARWLIIYLSKGRPKILYSNPCEEGTPLTDELSGVPIVCAVNDTNQSVCPALYSCTRVPGIAYSVCCPDVEEQEVHEQKSESTTKISREDSSAEEYQPSDEPRPQTSE